MLVDVTAQKMYKHPLLGWGERSACAKERTDARVVVVAITKLHDAQSPISCPWAAYVDPSVYKLRSIRRVLCAIFDDEVVSLGFGADSSVTIALATHTPHPPQSPQLWIISIQGYYCALRREVEGEAEKSSRVELNFV